ncbi:hypothetical protein M433DRAFT_154500 [Acidomyces richmondensis BFW]|nr:MAG: hypothetical protein FE78DRAFT_90591 [Acidomyces sp. 'richmondensis']KYG45433.1 hypothetical protein M433DRAFT_154500 [Acidomyces richmondensis BFW]
MASLELLETTQLQNVNQNKISCVIRQMVDQTAPLASSLDLWSRHPRMSRCCTVLQRMFPPRTDCTLPHRRSLGEKYLVYVSCACVVPPSKCLGCRSLSMSELPGKGSTASPSASQAYCKMWQRFPWQAQGVDRVGYRIALLQPVLATNNSSQLCTSAWPPPR